ncbi:MAG TPA: phosphoribosyltransferase family protein [Thermomicrobiales bacterium]|jgi:orotate phosphoribosyltransferase
MQQEAQPEALPARQGHFRLESGHHGERWFDLDPLFLRPAALQHSAATLANQLAVYRPELICGPLTGGAFLAQQIALALDVEFAYSERVALAYDTGLYTARYQVPMGLRAQVSGKRIAIVDDIINAGSAIRATHAELQAYGAQPVAFAALLTLGEAGAAFAASIGLPLLSLARQASGLWPPEECPLCAAGIPLEDVVTPQQERTNSDTR